MSSNPIALIPKETNILIVIDFQQLLSCHKTPPYNRSTYKARTKRSKAMSSRFWHKFNSHRKKMKKHTRNFYLMKMRK